MTTDADVKILRQVPAGAPAEGETVRLIAEAAGVSYDSARKALLRLREKGLVDFHRSDRPRRAPSTWAITQAGVSHLRAVLDTQEP